VAAGSALATHPVTVIFLAALWDSGFGAAASWARIPTLIPRTIAAHAADQILDFMVPPVFKYRLGVQL
jgi:hypothetical protein